MIASASATPKRVGCANGCLRECVPYHGRMTLALRDSFPPPSFLASRDPRWKWTCLILGGFGLAFIKGPVWAGLAALGSAFVCLIAGQVPMTVVLGRALLLAGSVAPMLLLLPVMNRQSGVDVALGLLGRLLAIGLAGLALTRTTRLPTLFAAAQNMGTPDAWVQILELAYRYLFLLGAEVRRMRVALVARGFRVKSNLTTYRTLGYSLGATLVQSADRAERVSEAMRARGFDGHFRTAETFHSGPQDYAMFFVMIVFLVSLILLDAFGPAWGFTR
ncbi:MAG: energy-coupling factor transporter transmembrane component T family protein [Fimbriiglobus sp.]